MLGVIASEKLLVVLNLLIICDVILCNSVQNSSFIAPQLRSGGWTPIPTNSKSFKQTESVERSASQPVSAKVQQVEHKRAQDSEMLPIPVIKPHRHGATLGFDLPEQGLTLYLDINELATKPLAQNIGLKVVSHEPQAQSSHTQTLNQPKPTQSHQNLQSHQNSGNAVNNKIYSANQSPLHQFVSKMQAINTNSPPKSPITVAKIQKRVKAVRNIGSFEGNGPSPVANGVAPTAALKPQKQLNKYHVGYVRPHDLQNALKHVGLTQSENEGQAISGGNNNVNTIISNPSPGPRTVVINTHSLSNNNINYEKLFNSPQTEQKKGSALDSFTQSADKFFNRPITPISSQVSQEVPNNSVRPIHNSVPSPAAYQYSSLQMPIRPSVQYPAQENEKERPDFPTPQRPIEQPVQQTTQEEEQEVDNEVMRKTTTPPPVLPPQQEDEQLKGFDDDIEQTTETVSGSRFEEPQRQVSGQDSGEQLDMDKFKQTTPSMPKPTTGAQLVPPTDESIVKVFPGADGQRPVSQQQNDLGDGPLPSCPTQTQTCQLICDAKTDNLITDAANIREIIHKLNADSILSVFPSMEEELQNIIDFASSDGYTMILPSNQAMARLPPNLYEFWKNNVNSLAPLLDNHVIDSAQSLEDMRLAQIIQPRSGSKLRVQRPHNDSYTINGERVTVANQVGPSGGMIHVIDGILYPSSDKDIMETLKTCNRLDGFVTLAEGTGFADTLKQSELRCAQRYRQI